MQYVYEPTRSSILLKHIRVITRFVSGKSQGTIYTALWNCRFWMLREWNASCVLMSLFSPALVRFCHRLGDARTDCVDGGLLQIGEPTQVWCKFSQFSFQVQKCFLGSRQVERDLAWMYKECPLCSGRVGEKKESSVHSSVHSNNMSLTQVH